MQKGFLGQNVIGKMPEVRTCCPSLPQVFRLEDSCCLFTLQGHSGAITTVYIDQVRGPCVGCRDTKPWALFLILGIWPSEPSGKQ